MCPITGPSKLPYKTTISGGKYNDDRRETGNLNYRPKGRSRSLINYFSCERWSEVELNVFPTAWQRMFKPTQSYIFYTLRGRLGLWEPSLTELNLITYVHLLWVPKRLFSMVLGRRVGFLQLFPNFLTLWQFFFSTVLFISA